MQFRHLYVHVPFCARRCVYCDFSIAVRMETPVEEYAGALARELAPRTEEFDDLDTLYLGGGTPSRLGGDGIARIIHVVRDRARLTADAEVTIEANPDDVSAAAVRAWRDAGVNRLSIGVQSFDDRVLSWMHRTHDGRVARAAVEIARDGGIPNVSVDLIFGTPDELRRDWKRDLDTVTDMDVPHASVYGLTVEPHTPLGRRVARQEVREAPEEGWADEFLAAHLHLTGAGFQHYEVSNYARGKAHSRHNWTYWNRRPYAGIGPSAHEFDGVTRRWNEPAYAAWLRMACGGWTTTAGTETLTESDVAAERIYLGLRTMSGVEVSDADDVILRPWVAAGWALVDAAGRLRLTAHGWLRLDSIASALTAFRSRS